MKSLVSLFACATLFSACAEADESSPITQSDTGVLDSGTPEAATDGAKDGDTTDTAIVSDTGVACIVGSTESRACGACGSQSRFCIPGGTFTAWTECSGEKTGTDCVVGDKQTVDCGNCGKQVDTCDPKTCTWVTGTCSGEGECAPGDTESTSASCADPTEKRTRTCGDKCSWGGFSSCAAPTGWQPMAVSPILGRIFHTAVWTGSRMVVWGGFGSSPSLKNDGASYDIGKNTWTTIATGPLTARRQHASVWTGSKLFIWGGYDTSVTMKTGALYDPATDSWTAIPDGPLSARHSSAIVWSPSTKEVIVWGGCTSGYCAGYAADGAAYNVETNTWSMLPASPLSARTDMAYGFVNGELVIWGGRTALTTMVVDGARFDPVGRAWVKFSDPASSVLDGRYDGAVLVARDALMMWGGRSSDSASTAKANGAYYQPSIGWFPIPAAPDTTFSPSPKRFDVSAWYAKGKLFVYSGIPSTASDLPYTGFVSYDFASETWKNEDLTGVTGYRARATAVWTGKEAVLWGGANGNLSSTYYNQGAIYRP